MITQRKAHERLNVLLAVLVAVLVALTVCRYSGAACMDYLTVKCMFSAHNEDIAFCVRSDCSRKGDMMIRRKMRYTCVTVPKNVTKKTEKVMINFDLFDTEGQAAGALSYRLKRLDDSWYAVGLTYSVQVNADRAFDHLREASLLTRQVFNADDTSDTVLNPAILAQRLSKSSKVKQVSVSDRTTTIPDKVDENLTCYVWTHDGLDRRVYAENAKQAARAITLALFDSGDRKTRIAFLEAGESDALEIRDTDSALDAERAATILAKVGLDIDSVQDPARIAALERSRDWNDKQRAAKKAAAETSSTA